MPVDRLEPLGQIQRIAEIQINSRLSVQPGIHYTCPTGKKAIAQINVMCTSRGAAGQVHLRDPTDTYNLLTWQGTGSPPNLDLSLAEGESRDIVMELNAGDTIQSTQNTGTNADFNVSGKILELDA